MKIKETKGVEAEKEHIFWVNNNDLTATSVGIRVNGGNHTHMALIQVNEIL